LFVVAVAVWSVLFPRTNRRSERLTAVGFPLIGLALTYSGLGTGSTRVADLSRAVVGAGVALLVAGFVLLARDMSRVRRSRPGV